MKIVRDRTWRGKGEELAGEEIRILLPNEHTNKSLQGLH
jgi:hypothetical protein